MINTPVTRARRRIRGTARPILTRAGGARQAARRACAVLLGVALLAGCATPPRPEAPAPDAAARTLAAQGEPRAAARAYLELAREADAADRPRWLLAAARLLADSGELDATARILTRLDERGLTPAQRVTRGLLLARVDLARGAPRSALGRLSRTAPEAADAEQLVSYHRLRAEAYAALGNHLESARERVWLDGLLAPARRTENHQAIWNELSQLSDRALARLGELETERTLAGWMELVRLARDRRLEAAGLERALADWRADHPDHPADVDLVQGLLDLAAAGPGRPRNLALLLPLTGPLADTAAAVRDGFLSAALTAEGDATAARVRIYDTGPGTRRVWSSYQRAVDDGADLVVGPLAKEAVAGFTDSRLSAPLLALNRVEHDAPPPAPTPGAALTPATDAAPATAPDRDGQAASAPLYQFGLAPEDEAAAAAERAWRDGHRRAVMLTPDDPWGERLARAFDATWTGLGGALLDQARYDPNQTDYAGPLRQVLGLDDSARRHAALTRVLGRRLHFEPRRRQDIDAVFLAAFPRQARLLVPQLRFHRAAGLPAYATSHVYTGQRDAADQDMDGLRFCDMPWVLAGDETPEAALRGRLRDVWRDRFTRQARLFALGVDAYRLTSLLPRMARGSYMRVPGVTGTLLYLDPERRVHRELAWARFEDGAAVPLAPVVEDSVEDRDDDDHHPGTAHGGARGTLAAAPRPAAAGAQSPLP